MTTENTENTKQDRTPAVASSDLLGQWDCKDPHFDSVEVVEINAVWVRFRTRWGMVRRSRRGFMKNYRPNAELSGGGPLSNETTEAESRRPLE